MPITPRVRGFRGWGPGHRTNRAISPSGRCWKGGWRSTRRSTRARPYLGHHTGRGTASCPSGLSSGRTCHSGCMTALCIHVRRAAGRSASSSPELMATPPEQAEAAAFLQRLAGAAPVETHISLVFVGRDTVWKLKKAVQLAFLDFSEVEARRRFSLRELELNQVAAPGMYRDVVALVRRADGSLSLDEEGEVLDWVLRMARVPKEDFLDEIAAAGGLTPELLDALGDAVAEYHRKLPMASPGVVGAMRHVTDGNARSALDAGLPSAEVAAWQSAAISALEGIAHWLAQREQDGFVRRAHGDLHLG